MNVVLPTWKGFQTDPYSSHKGGRHSLDFLLDNEDDDCLEDTEDDAANNDRDNDD